MPDVFSYEQIVARAKTVKEGDTTLPKQPVQPRGPKQPLARFDVEEAKKRALAAQKPRTEEDLERLASSL